MNAPVLFCPFCREGFEDEHECPDHELPLVPWQRLPPEAHDGSADRPVGPWEARYGRGPVAVGSLATVVAFFLPCVSLRGAREATSTMLELALNRAGRLWIVPLACVFTLMTLFRRRTLTAMRGARLAVPIVALMPSVALVMTLIGARDAADFLSLQLGQEVSVQVEVGSYVVLLALPIMVVGGVRLGVGRAGLANTGSPDGDAGRRSRGRASWPRRVPRRPL